MTYLCTHIHLIQKSFNFNIFKVTVYNQFLIRLPLLYHNYCCLFIKKSFHMFSEYWHSFRGFYISWYFYHNLGPCTAFYLACLKSVHTFEKVLIYIVIVCNLIDWFFKHCSAIFKQFKQPVGLPTFTNATHHDGGC